jgi:hypothetical protein
VKSLKAFALLLVLSFPLNANADVTEEIKEGDIPGTTTTLKKKATKDPLKGFTLKLGVGSSHRLNVEPDNASWISSYEIKAGYNLGKQLFPKTFFKGLRLVSTFSFSNEFIGNSSKYRTSYFSNPDFLSQNVSYLGVDDSMLTESESSDVDYKEDGTQKRVDYSDIIITMKHDSIAKLPGGIGLAGSLGFSIPTSLTSRNAGLKTKMDYNLGVSKIFKLGKKMLIVGYDFTFTHYIYSYTTPGINHLDDGFVINGVEYDTVNYNTAGRLSEFGYTNMGYLMFQPIKKLTILGAYALLTFQSQKFENCIYTTPDGMQINVCATTDDVRGYDDGSRGTRDYQMFMLSASYKMLDYLSLSLTLNTFTPQTKANSTDYQQPFLSFNRNNYSSLMFKVSYSFDSFYKKKVR